MNVLLIGAIFPPENAISAVRIGKFAQYLDAEGDSIRVITRQPRSVGLETLQRDLPGIKVFRFPDPLSRLETVAKPKVGLQTGPFASVFRLRNSQLFRRLKLAAGGLLFWPDRFVFWALIVLAKHRSDGWKPDVVVASGPPMSVFIIANLLARKYGCPWVADYRDLLSSGPYYDSGQARLKLDRGLELRLVASAQGLTTVSSPLARDLLAFHGKPADVVMNGFDPGDFRGPRSKEPADRELILTYCGEIYPGRRDPTSLFEAIALLRNEGTKVQVRFYGNSVAALKKLAIRYDMGDSVRFFPRVSHTESIAIQERSDVLLLLMWDDPREEGVYSGKVFEYVGARRPILMLGFADGVAAELVRIRGLGIVANDPKCIAMALKDWANEKSRKGGIPCLPKEAGAGLTRREQTMILRDVLIRATESR